MVEKGRYSSLETEQTMLHNMFRDISTDVSVALTERALSTSLLFRKWLLSDSMLVIE